MSQKFTSAYQKIKAFFAESLNAENTEQITALTQELETMNQEMDQEEKNHQATKNKMVDYVKNTQFKVDSTIPSDIDDSPKSLNEAKDIALKELINNRKKENKK